MKNERYEKVEEMGGVLLLFVVLAVGGSRTAQAEMLDMTKYNDDLITVSKVPHGKAGNKISIKMTVHNNGSKGDNYLKTIRLANADQYDQFYTYDDDDDDDSDSDSNISWSGKHFPFEADSNTFKEKRIDVKPGSSKSVTLTYKLRRMAAGYYQAFFYIDDSLKSASTSGFPLTTVPPPRKTTTRSWITIFPSAITSRRRMRGTIRSWILA